MCVCDTCFPVRDGPGGWDGDNGTVDGEREATDSRKITCNTPWEEDLTCLRGVLGHGDSAVCVALLVLLLRSAKNKTLYSPFCPGSPKRPTVDRGVPYML